MEHANADGTFMVRFDKEGYEYHCPLTSWRVPKIRHAIAELEEGEVLQGRVQPESVRRRSKLYAPCSKRLARRLYNDYIGFLLKA